MIKILNKKRLIVVTLILTALIFTTAFGIISYNFFISRVNAQGPGGGQGAGNSGEARNTEAEGENNEDSFSVEAAEVKEDDFYIYTTVSAESEAFKEVALTPRIQEVITEVMVDMGDTVKKDEKLIKMDARSNEIRKLESEASLRSAEANLQQTLNGPREEEISQLKAKLEQAESELKLRRESYERQKELYEEEYSSKEELDQANNQLVAAQSSYQSALKDLEMTESGPTEEEIIQLESQVTQAESALKSTELELAHTEIESPINGVITEINAQRGQMAPNDIIVRVSNIDKIILNAFVNEKHVNNLMKGEDVSIDFNALDNEFQGKIKSISSRAATDRRSFPVEVIVDNPDNIIKAGMTAQISLPIDRAKDAVIISQDALLEDTDGFYTFVVQDGKVEKRDLKIGLNDEDNAVVTSGLEAEEKVVTLGKENLSDGSSVEIANRGDNK